ncbi:MAG: hypothetical protein J3K34DRAFT_284935 [Monoraphidium minutum]|nr:MAG: hypothetical protein J3K34DRAFT_284935 [Monoraphidium minutum]
MAAPRRGAALALLAVLVALAAPAAARAAPPQCPKSAPPATRDTVTVAVAPGGWPVEAPWPSRYVAFARCSEVLAALEEAEAEGGDVLVLLGGRAWAATKALHMQVCCPDGGAAAAAVVRPGGAWWGSRLGLLPRGGGGGGGAAACAAPNALFEAAAAYDASRVECLLDSGQFAPDMRAVGHNALTYMLLERWPNPHRSLAERAWSVDERLTQAALLLVRRGAAPDIRASRVKDDGSEQTGLTPLMAAAYQGDYVLVRALLAAGADATAVDSKGLSALSRVLNCGGPGSTPPDFDCGLSEVAPLLLLAGARLPATLDRASVPAGAQTPATRAGAWRVTDARAAGGGRVLGVSTAECPRLANFLLELNAGALRRGAGGGGGASAAGAEAAAAGAWVPEGADVMSDAWSLAETFDAPPAAAAPRGPAAPAGAPAAAAAGRAAPSRRRLMAALVGGGAAAGGRVLAGHSEL